MPDLAAILLRKSMGSLDSGRQRCSDCRRVPLVGECLHEMDNGRTLCSLCLTHLPAEKRQAVRVERVHASERSLAIVPRAA